MKKVLFGFAFAVALPLFAQQKPVYLDAAKPIEDRVEDASKKRWLCCMRKVNSAVRACPAWVFLNFG